MNEAVIMYKLKNASDWWSNINNSPVWQECIFYILAGLYALVAALALLAMCLVLWWKYIHVMVILSKMFFAGVSLFAALGFLIYCGRLFLMLQLFAVESKGRHKKLQDVGYVNTICFTCFLIRCIMMCFNAFDKAANIDVLNHLVLSFIYYLMRWHPLFPCCKSVGGCS